VTEGVWARIHFFFHFFLSILEKAELPGLLFFFFTTVVAFFAGAGLLVEASLGALRFSADVDFGLKNPSKDAFAGLAVRST